jgi:hypothetical protein
MLNLVRSALSNFFLVFCIYRTHSVLCNIRISNRSSFFSLLWFFLFHFFLIYILFLFGFLIKLLSIIPFKKYNSLIDLEQTRFDKKNIHNILNLHVLRVARYYTRFRSWYSVIQNSVFKSLLLTSAFALKTIIGFLRILINAATQLENYYLCQLLFTDKRETRYLYAGLDIKKRDMLTNLQKQEKTILIIVISCI